MKTYLKNRVNILLLFIFLINSVNIFCQTLGFETKIILSEKISHEPGLKLGIKLYSAQENGLSNTRNYGTLYNYQLIYKTVKDNHEKGLITVARGNIVFFTDQDYLQEHKNANQKDDNALIRIGDWGVNLNINYYPVMIRENQTTDLTVSSLIKQLVNNYNGLLGYYSGRDKDSIVLVIINEGQAKDSILTIGNRTDPRKLKHLSDFLYFLWNKNKPPLGVILEDYPTTIEQPAQDQIIVKKEEYVVEPVIQAVTNKSKVTGQENINLPSQEQPYSFMHTKKTPGDILYRVEFKKRHVYNTLMKLPDPYSFYVNKDATYFNYYLPDSLNKIWMLYPNDTLPFSRRDSKSARVLKIGRRLKQENYTIHNTSGSPSGGIPDFYTAFLKHYQPLKNKKKEIKISAKPANILTLYIPYQVLPVDSVYIRIKKPFGYNIHNNDSLSRYNSWEYPYVTLNCLDRKEFTIRWIKMPPQEVYYFDLSDTHNRKATINVVNSEFEKTKKQNSAFVFYISNTKKAIIINNQKDFPRVLKTLSNLEPLTPDISFDADHLSKDVVSERGEIRYHFFISDLQYSSSNFRLITKFLMEEYHLLATGLNEDDLNAVLKEINKDKKKAFIKIYLHHLNKVNPQPDNTLEDVKYINWEN